MGTPVEQRRYLLTTDEVRLLLAEGHPKFAAVSESDPTPETNDDMAAVRALPAMQTLALHYQRGWMGLRITRCEHTMSGSVRSGGSGLGQR